MSRISKAAVAAAIIIAAMTMPARADSDRYTVVVTRHLTFRGGKVSIEHRFGSINIRTHGGRA